MKDVKLDYIMKDDVLELGEQLGADLFAVWIVREIDQVNDRIDSVKEGNSELLKELKAEKRILEKVRKAYNDLSK